MEHSPSHSGMFLDDLLADERPAPPRERPADPPATANLPTSSLLDELGFYLGVALSHEYASKHEASRRALFDVRAALEADRN
ncbi:hypothetical protein [Mycobacterium sp. GA-2829]|uniref:hypothetical protein n=1 Tax=Mycobacterium sp. GA-2829 TaxID=1772283 RepID=UPI000B048EC5|nr:hypothetical protein [Mycobacterium sp. GA-2829]